MSMLSALVTEQRHSRRNERRVDETLRLRRQIFQLEREVLALRRELEQERHQANSDPLTGIANRRAYLQRLQEERTRSLRSGRTFSLVVWDIDHFKAINDRFGHRVGDQVIAQVAGMINRRLRDSDFLARIGGEEFVALLPECEGDNARQMADELRRTIARSEIEVDGARLRLTLSCGVSQFVMQDSDCTLFCRADAALYRAKEKGRNRVCLAPS